MALTRLEERAKEKGKILLIENFSISSPTHPIPQDRIQLFSESRLMVEASGEKYSALAVIKDVPVTKFTENLNGRIYLKPLWERIAKELQAEGTYCLAGHPTGDDDGDPSKISGVWHNFKVLENTCVADLYLVGANGKLLLEAIQAGGKAGMSSVGFGELGEDNKTVITESYELDRTADWVLNPSQQVFATMENYAVKSIPESTKTTTKPISEVVTNKYKQIGESNMSDAITKLVESNLKSQVKAALRSEKRGSSLIESQELLKDALEATPESHSNEKIKLEEALDRVSEKLEATVSNQAKELEFGRQSFAELKSRYGSVKETVASLKEENHKITSVLTELGLTGNSLKEVAVVKANIKILKENEQTLKTDLAKLVEDKDKIESDMLMLEEDACLQNEDLEAFVEDTNYRDNDIKRLLGDAQKRDYDITSYSEDLAKAQRDVQILYNELAQHIDIKRFQSVVMNEMEMNNYSKNGQLPMGRSEIPKGNQSYEKKYRGDFAKRQTGLSGLEKQRKNAYLNPPGNTQVSTANSTSSKSYQSKYGHGDTVEKSRTKGVKPQIPSGSYSDAMGVAAFDNNIVSRTAQSESTIGKHRLFEFFDSQVKKNPSIKDIKGHILRSSSLVEAANMIEAYVKNKPSTEAPMRLNEAIARNSKSEWLSNRR